MYLNKQIFSFLSKSHQLQFIFNISIDRDVTNSRFDGFTCIFSTHCCENSFSCCCKCRDCRTPNKVPNWIISQMRRKHRAFRSRRSVTRLAPSRRFVIAGENAGKIYRVAARSEFAINISEVQPETADPHLALSRWLGLGSIELHSWQASNFAGESCCGDEIAEYTSFLRQQLGDVYIRSVSVEEDGSSDLVNSLSLHPFEQINRVCRVVKNDPNFASGYNAIGLSQGALFV